MPLKINNYQYYKVESSEYGWGEFKTSCYLLRINKKIVKFSFSYDFKERNNIECSHKEYANFGNLIDTDKPEGYVKKSASKKLLRNIKM